MTPASWPWRGRSGKREEPAGTPTADSPAEDSASAHQVGGDSTPALELGGLPAVSPSSDGSTVPVPADTPACAGMSSSVQVEVSGEGSVGAGRDVSHSAVGAGSRVEHNEVDNRIENTIVGGDVFQAGRDLTINNHPAPPPERVWRPVRVGAMPPLASAFQPRPGLREEIDQARERNATVVLTQVLSGGGGVGKSQLAAHYAHRAHAEGVDVLVWVNAAETAQIITTYAEAAAKACVPGADGQDAESDARAFLDWLAVTERSWLVVLDDLTDLEGAAPWWPRPPAGANGRVLATTRRRDALVTGNGRAIVDIGTYTLAEALAYLRERLAEAGVPHLLDDAAGDLVEALGLLPLALAHAAAYMINEEVGCATYLDLFTDRALRLENLLPPDADTDNYGRRVTTSLLLALDAADHREPTGLATPAIRLAAHLDPAGHPDTLWTTHAVTDYLTTHRTPPPTSTATPEPVTSDQARSVLRLLHHYALITHHPHDAHRAVRLHALTARAARETTPPTDTPATVRTAADALAETWPELEHTARDLAAVLRANTDILADLAGDLLWHPDGHVILFAAGKSLTAVGLFYTAVTHWQRLTANATLLLGDDHPDTLTARGNLATSYRRAGRTGEAIVLEEQVLTDSERILGDDHPDTLTARSNLAHSYWRAGLTGEAIMLEEQVLTDSERILGDDHPDTLTARGNLAASYRQAGRTGEALVLEEQVLADRERILGHDHPDTLTARGNLAFSYGQAGLTGEALVLEEQVLAESERLLGDDHPNTLTARGNLAHSYRQAGRTGEALVLEEQVLAESERLLGDDHPNTLTARGNLAASYAQAGRIGEALVLDERVAAESERLLGDDHPDTLTARANLAASYAQAGRTDEAVDLLRSVAADQARVLGPGHPDAVLSRVDLATVLTRRGRGLLAGDTAGAWRDAAEAVGAVGPYLSDDPATYGPVLADAYGLAAAVLDADGQPQAAADSRSRALQAAGTAPPPRPGDGAADGSRS
ncbi:tetratricopeptide repeat protein (plasmid) [Kitasatospora purpeofusca]|uniref:tetratricopeptide repeat protein n=1 Tax=Kitasatospora purpeofusca TaxID=67352 RepID=UPI002E13573A|nr:tetratricopeptide repeat protein [Kitasatospora purpeofusca]